jgi:hypothetical protein
VRHGVLFSVAGADDHGALSDQLLSNQLKIHGACMVRKRAAVKPRTTAPASRRSRAQSARGLAHSGTLRAGWRTPSRQRRGVRRPSAALGNGRCAWEKRQRAGVVQDASRGAWVLDRRGRFATSNAISTMAGTAPFHLGACE